MMLIKPYKRENQDLWFHIRQPRIGDVDIADKYFGIKGEFSPYSDIAFQKHINRLTKFGNNPFYFKFNGKRIKKILQQEGLWY